MQIIIEYSSSWRNSFLDGDNNKPLSKDNKRKFIASMINLKKDENYIERNITKDTVMGILNRLIGEQAKLYKARKRDDYYFKDIEVLLDDDDIVDTSEISEELIYLRNMTGSTDQNTFSGLVKSTHDTFNSHYSNEFWGVLWLTWEQLVQFILDDNFSVLDHIEKINLDPLVVRNKAEEVKKYPKIKSSDVTQKVFTVLEKHFPNKSYIEKNDTLKQIRFYSAALYLQLERLEKKYKEPIACNFDGGEKKVFGFSKRGFNSQRDFMKNFVTGGEKLIYGGAYVTNKGKKLRKATGQLIINLDIPKEQALDLETKINNAGVSAFYLGKKGLAYVKEIRI